MAMKLLKEKQKDSYKALKDELNLKNAMQAPKILKAVVSVGVGSFKDKKRIELTEDRLGKITGQKPVRRGAKQAVATFKTRQGDIVGLQVTLRGVKMWSFLDPSYQRSTPSYQRLPWHFSYCCRRYG
jgi:large subunit ribosomal protein L5